MDKVREKLQRVGEKVRPGRDFGERRAVVERARSAAWQVTIALIAATIGAAALGYLVVQLYFLPDTLREAQLNRVPGLTGMDLEDAVRRGEDAGYAVVVAGRAYSDEVERAEIIFQSPPPATYLPRGDTLRVLVSLGPADERIPDVSGLDLELARRVLGPMGLRIGAVSREASDIHPQGTVIRTDPPADAPLARRGDDTAVAIVLSRGGSRLVMPDVRGLTLPQARDTLEVYSLMVGRITGLAEGEQPPEGVPVVVTGQEPSPGRLVPAGSSIDIALGPARAARDRGVEPPPAREPLAPPREAAPRGEEPEGDERAAAVDERPAAADTTP